MTKTWEFQVVTIENLDIGISRNIARIEDKSNGIKINVVRIWRHKSIKKIARNEDISIEIRINITRIEDIDIKVARIEDIVLATRSVARIENGDIKEKDIHMVRTEDIDI
jgi:hypothetical protein